MHQAFDSASRAHDSGDGAAAKSYSNAGHEHQRQRDALNAQAADWIFNTNNRSQPAGSIDLHGLYVQEAIERTEQAVQRAQAQGLDQLRVITGKGIHSSQHTAKIKPAIEKLMVKYNLAAHLEQGNAGVLVVDLRGGAGGAGGSRDVSCLGNDRMLTCADGSTAHQLGWVDQADRESDDGQCIVM